MKKPVPWVKYEKIEENGGRFVVSPLDHGMGITLGNSMRRVLLSALSGHAVSSIKIDGVQHEFSTIPDVIEDVLDVICNVKQLVFKSNSLEPKVLRVEKKGKGLIKASDIKGDSEYTIVNPELKLAELSDNGKFVMEITVKPGKGYVDSESNQEAGNDVDTISVDSSFSPVVRVNHQVENIRVGKELDYDSLTLDVWTNGGITPEEAVKNASSILVEKFGLFENLNEKPVNEEGSLSSEQSESGSSDSALNLSVDDLELSARSSNCLKRAGIETVAELIEKDMSELIQIKNFGKKSADEINDKLKQYNLALKDSENTVIE